MEKLFNAVLLLVFLGACNTQSIPAALKANLLQYGSFVVDVYDLNATTIARPVEVQGYNITSYLYSTAETDPLFIGFIGVSTSRNNVAVVLRGTVTLDEWVGNALVRQTPFPYLNGSAGPNVHSGFLALFNTTSVTDRKSLRQQIVAGLEKVYDKTKHSITLAGHSLGGALAILCAFDAANSNLGITSNQMQVYTFASPMVGDESFKEFSQGLNILRVADIRDLVPYLPSVYYVHTGTQLSVDGCSFQSSHAQGLLSMIKEYHDMDRYLYTVSRLSSNVSSSSKASAASSMETSLLSWSDIPGFLKKLVHSFDEFVELMEDLGGFLSNFPKVCEGN